MTKETNFAGKEGTEAMTEKYKQKAYQEEEPKDWWGDFLKELKVKYGKDKSKREDGTDSEDANTHKTDI